MEKKVSSAKVGNWAYSFIQVFGSIMCKIYTVCMY